MSGMGGIPTHARPAMGRERYPTGFPTRGRQQ